MRFVSLAVLLLVAPPVLLAQAPAPGSPQPSPSPSASSLPVRRVVLYKTGVGYFEHLGRVRGQQDVTVRFTSAQLNDVLKSLTTIDLGGGQVSGISYNSVAPLEQRLGALRLPLTQGATSADLYSALRGARVEVSTSSGATTGRLLGVERIVTGTKADPLEQTGLTVVGDDGAVRTFELGPGVRVRLLERDLRQELDRYLDVVGSTREQDARAMVISTSGTGERELFVSYISEVPIWKSTYRLVLPAGSGKPLLQGWAIVDNTIGEDWDGVELSLVAGAPQSFIQPISQPYYGRRSVVPMPPTYVSAPQTHAATLTIGRGTVTGRVRDAGGAALPGATVTLVEAGASAPTAITASNGAGEFRLDVPAGTYTLTASLEGFRSAAFGDLSIRPGESRRHEIVLQIGAATESVMVRAETPASRSGQGSGLRPGQGGGVAGGTYSNVPGGRVGGVVGGVPEPPPAPASPMRDSVAPDAYARARAQSAADAAALGDLFEYRIATPVTLAKNQSALVPIVNAEVSAEKVALWSRTNGNGRPLRAVWLHNGSGLTLDGGSMAIVDGNAFAGEGLVEPLKPGERRLVSYATDLGTLVRARQEDGPYRVRRVTARNGILTRETERRATWTYTARNENDGAVTLVIEHRPQPGWKVDAGQSPAESSPDADRFRLVVDPGKEAALSVRETQADQASILVGEVTGEWIAEVGAAGIPLRELEAALQPVLQARDAVAQAQTRMSALVAESARIGEDQNRVRENMKALRGSREEKALLERYARQLNDQEDRLAELRRDTEAAVSAVELAQERLAAAIAALTFELPGAR